MKPPEEKETSLEIEQQESSVVAAVISSQAYFLPSPFYTSSKSSLVSPLSIFACLFLLDVFSARVSPTAVPESQDMPVKFTFACPHLAREVDQGLEKQLNKIQRHRDIYVLLLRLLLLFNLHVWLHLRSGSQQTCEQGIALRKTSILGQAAPTAQASKAISGIFKNTEVKSFSIKISHYV